MVVLGIDAAWTSTNPSGLAVLVKNNHTTGWNCVAVAPSYTAFFGLAENKPVDWGVAHKGTWPEPAHILACAERLAGARVDLIAIDMPLSKREIDGRRPADREISKEYGSRWCSAHSPSQIRPGRLGAVVSEEFRRLGYSLATTEERPGTLPRIIEVYPHPALLSLLGRDMRVPYKVSRAKQYWPGKSVTERVNLLLGEYTAIYNRLSELFGEIPFHLPAPAKVHNLSNLKRYEDALDAIVSAWVGIQYTTGEAMPFGDADAAVWCPVSSIWSAKETTQSEA